MKRSESRQQALATGASVYVGRCCNRCGGRRRYTSNAGCKRCCDAVAKAQRRLSAEHRVMLLEHTEQLVGKDPR